MSSLTPLSPDQALALARQRYEQGQLPAATLILQAVLTQSPEHHEAASLLAALYLQQGDPAAAESLLRQSLASGTDSAVLWCNLGTSLMDQGRGEAALHAYAEAAARDDGFALPWYNRGNLLGDAKRFAEAAENYREALRRSPHEARIWNNLGNVYLALGDYAESEKCYAGAIECDPDDPTAIASRANLHDSRGDYRAAEADYRAVLPVIANGDGARFNLALNLFRQGRYEEAFPLYEHRWQGCPDLLGQYRYPPERQWRGENLAGRRILLWTEQGLGDTLQFARFIPQVQALAGEVVVVCHPAVVALFSASFPGVSVVSRDTAPAFGDFDWHCPLMSLCLALAAPAMPSMAQIEADTPLSIPYLRVPTASQQVWHERLAEAERHLPPARLRIGLCWKSGQGMEHHSRSLSLAALAALDVTDARYFRLLKPEAFRSEEAPPADWLASGRWLDLAADFTDFAATAALIEQLDVVVSVDTSVLHIAAALGKPVWGLFPQVGGNFFPHGRSDSPWYPSLRVVRQSQAGSWHEAIQQIARALALPSENPLLESL